MPSRSACPFSRLFPFAGRSVYNEWDADSNPARVEQVNLMLPVVLPTAAPAGRARGVLELTPEELRAWLHERGQPPLRAKQIRHWILVAGAESFEQMTDLPRGLRQELAEAFVPLASRVERHLKAADDTHKLLLALADGGRIECVLIQDQGRRTACISTQVGCGMGCVFCASGINGVARNLTSGEILEQLVRLRNLPAPRGPGVERLTHIVVMGMGEPLANLDHLVAALDVAIHKDGLGIGARHVTISTVGLPAKIRRLADLGKQYHLAVSLHARPTRCGRGSSPPTPGWRPYSRPRITSTKRRAGR